MFATPKQSSRSSLLGRTPLTAGRRSVQPTPRNPPGIATRSARAEQILEETGQHVVKALNSPVPVQVQEALRSNVRAASIKLHESGWAWLVAGSKLFLWKFSTMQPSAHCQQLPLPSSGGATWHAELVTVCIATDSSVAVMVVSSKGSVCYWSNALHDPPTSLEGSVDMGEGQGYMLVSLPSGRGGCLLATTLCDLFLITPPVSQSGLGVRQLHVPRGMFSGFGRRVSSLFFGSPDSDVQEARGVAVAASGSSGKDVAFVLTNCNLQKWSIESSSEQMQYDAGLEGMIKEAVIQQGWFADVQTTQCTLWIVSVQLTREYVCILFAVVKEETTAADHGLALIQADSDIIPLTVDHLIRLNHLTPYRPGGEALLTSYSLLSAPFTSDVLVYNRNTVLVANVEQTPQTGSAPDLVNFPNPNGIIGTAFNSLQYSLIPRLSLLRDLGMRLLQYAYMEGVYNGGLLFFTLNQGVVSVAHQSSGRASHSMPPPSSSSSFLLATPSLGLPTTALSLSREASADKIEALKNAFLEYLSGNTVDAAASCEYHFPAESFSFRQDTPGDLAVMRLSELVLDDIPATDPRQTETMSRDIPGSSSSVIIIYQLEDKLKAHSRYLQFITDIGLLDKLTCVHVRGRPMLTRHLICEHAEKITAAIALRKMHNQVVDQAIKLALRQRPSSLPSHPSFTNQENFYSYVSYLEDICPALLATEEDLLPSFSSPNERIQLVLNMAAILEAMLHEAVQYRQAKSSLYQSCLASEVPEPEWLPWTASLGSSGTRKCISQQLQLMLDVGVRDAETAQDQEHLWRLVVDLCDLLFDGYTAQIASIEKNPTLSEQLAGVTKHFEEDRERFLMPLLEHGQYQQAGELGEKYGDFQVLVQLCEKMGSRRQLQEYMKRFSTKGFADFLFKQYLDQGKLQQLLSFSEDFPQELGEFLEPHDNLNWMHQVVTQNYNKAHQTLHRMAKGEAKYVGKKKTLLSLSKLSMLASDSTDTETLQALNRELQVIEFQQNIPIEALEANGLVPEEMPPLQPEKIIQLYVGDKNFDGDEMQYIFALELLDLAYPDRTSEKSQELRLYIWSQAALKDDWSQLSTDDPLAELQGTFFSRLVEEAYNRSSDVLLLLPELETLLTSKQLVAAGLTENPIFQFLMKACYEQIERVQTANSN